MKVKTLIYLDDLLSREVQEAKRAVAFYEEWNGDAERADDGRAYANERLNNAIEALEELRAHDWH